MARYSLPRALGMIPVLACALGIDSPAYAACQKVYNNCTMHTMTGKANQNLPDTSSEPVSSILSDIAWMLKEGKGVIGEVPYKTKGKNPSSGKAYVGMVPAIRPDGSEYPPLSEKLDAFFVYVDMGNDGPTEGDALETTLPFGESKITFIDIGLDGPTPGDRIYIDGQRVRKNKVIHRLWEEYIRRLPEAREILRQRGAIRRTTRK